MNLITLALTLVSAVSPTTQNQVFDDARSAFEAANPADRTDAERIYASILIEGGHCDEGVALLARSKDSNPINSDWAMRDAINNNHLSCAAKLSDLTLRRLKSHADNNTILNATIRLLAGAALQAGGESSRGESEMRNAEITIMEHEAHLGDYKVRENSRILWTQRYIALSFLVGTPSYETILLRYGKELSADPNMVWTLQSGPIIVRLAAARHDALVQNILSKIWIFERKKIQNQLDSDLSGAKISIYGIPHCPHNLKSNSQKIPSVEENSSKQNGGYFNSVDRLRSIYNSSVALNREIRCHPNGS